MSGGSSVHVTGKLREGQYRDVQVLGNGFEAAGDFRDLDGAVLAGLEGVGAAQELQIVDDEEPDAVLALQRLGGAVALRVAEEDLEVPLAAQADGDASRIAMPAP